MAIKDVLHEDWKDEASKHTDDEMTGIENDDMDVEPPKLFYTISWERWMELQSQTIQALSWFQHAAEHPNAHSLVHAAEDLMTVAFEVLREAALWVPYQDIPYCEIPEEFSIHKTYRRKK
ncbi:hypothetical protein EPA93_24415 [Ktedonosporobacter rubrisoli]|uniref:Uncharacterized protein n=1 Tax=Ktedonosporobacter rubrisoli TaxID=2509675 RepID=A0A4P6JUE3_KTERU|nr:hypothetical protein [Ktedonosporobacter rubrisoli]QBD78955.1 hypothetical protein EPA93_24415 [Ktedonosporobacter rubrisoli]